MSSIPVCPINRIGIRHPTLSSDGYVYEEKCLEEWIIKMGNRSSPVNRQHIEYVKHITLDDLGASPQFYGRRWSGPPTNL